MSIALLALAASAHVADPEWKEWLHNFGHDTYVYPDWINAQREQCVCDKNLACHTTYRPQRTNELSYCAAKQWLLDHMPRRDLRALPPSVSVTGTGMLDDEAAFAAMADSAVSWSADIDVKVKMAYIMPYTDNMESVVNKRGLLFAKYFHLTTNAVDTNAAMQQLAGDSLFTRWSNNPIETAPSPVFQNYTLAWSSSTSPPVTGPADFVTYGYGSCTGWAGMTVNVARALGIPARLVGSPCWNSGDYAGSARTNPNVSLCWGGGTPGEKGPVGGGYLYNHNWLEYWDSINRVWNFVNAPPESPVINNGWMCPNFSRSQGCCGGQAHNASADHEIFAYTWSLPIDGLPEGILSGSNLTLSNGEAVSPLVWSPRYVDAFGTPVSHELRMINRTDFYRCKNQ